MVDKTLYQDCISILEQELRPALGCTEPIAVAYAAARAREVLGCVPEKMEVCCSGNIIKNVKGVYVPNSEGMKGIEAAALLGMVAGRPEKELEVLNDVTPSDLAEVNRLREMGVCRCTLKEGVAALYILVTVEAGERSASVEVRDTHTNVTRVERDGKLLLDHRVPEEEDNSHLIKRELTLEDILAFAREVRIEDIKPVLDQQIRLNRAISREGLENPYGAQIGRLLMARAPNDIRMRARARAAAGSDARMSGCPLPVVINSGSGNQGITASIPVLAYAEALGTDEERIYRALAISNLTAIHQKAYIGSLSAFCGAVCAAAGSGAAIAYLMGGTDEQIKNAVVNTLANIGGMVCDGAKPSCAAKIASAVEAAIMAVDMSLSGNDFAPGDGIVQDSPEKTIQAIGRVGRSGMRATDIEILQIMLGT